MSDLIIEINVENEQIILGALINCPETMKRELSRLRREQFIFEEHQTIFDALRQIRKEGAEYTADAVVQVTNNLIELKYMKDLERGFPAMSAENFALHLRILEKARIKHSANDAFEKLYKGLEDPHSDIEESEQAAAEIVRNLRQARDTANQAVRSDVFIKQWKQDLVDIIEKKAELFRPFYFSGLDDLLYEGLKPGCLVVIAGRPGMGKSTFISNITARQAIRGRRVLSVPVEAGKQSVADQIACAYSGVSAETLVKQPDELSKGELFNLNKALEKVLGKGNVVFDDQMNSIDDLEGRLDEESFDVAFLDLFEYLIPGRKEPDVVTDCLRRIRKLGRRRGCAMVVVHQIRRIQRKKNARPLLTELKNSGGYEEVADLVLLLHRDKYYSKDADCDDLLEINIAKQRRGPQNETVAFQFLPETCRVGRQALSGRKGGGE